MDRGLRYNVKETQVCVMVRSDKIKISLSPVHTGGEVFSASVKEGITFKK
jgi:hypothetical protein